MIKARIHIESGYTWMDDNLYYECLLPCPPIIGAFFDMTDDINDYLILSALRNIEVFKNYKEYLYADFHKYSEMFITEDIFQIIKKENESCFSFSFEDCNLITKVQFVANQEWIDIEISR